VIEKMRGSEQPNGFDHPALVVWNMQIGTLPYAHNKEELLKNACELVKSSRANNVPVIYSQHANLPFKWMDPETRTMLVQMGKDQHAGWMQAGTQEWEIVRDLKPEADDLVLSVHTPSFFTGTPLESILHRDGVRTIVIAGFATHSGILVTARQGVLLGFNMVVVEDAVGGITADHHESALKLLRQGCDVMTTSEVIPRLRRNSVEQILPPPLLGWRDTESPEVDHRDRHDRRRI
jgi:nicotinamidase-related amidase